MTPQERAAAIAAKAKTQPPVDERRLNAAIDRSMPARMWYRITRNGNTFDVAFNPEQTLPEARARYPDCTVEA